MKFLKLYLLLCFIGLGSCKKFLDEKPNSKLAVPTTLAELQGLLDHYQVLNQVDAAAGEISSTDYYLTDADFATQTEQNQRMYTWQRSNIFVADLNDWVYNYRAIYRANSVLHFAEQLPKTDSQLWNSVKGQAYFYRAKNLLTTLYQFSQLPPTAAMGVPIRLGIDFNEASVRVTAAEGYQQVIDDLKQAIAHLPLAQVHVMRPAKPAAFALLARTYWSLGDYPNAYAYADSCLKLKSQLLDFNTLNAAAVFPVAQYNVEVLHVGFLPASILNNSRAKIANDLVALYETNDLRATIFLKNNGNGTYGFKGSYDGSAGLFSGQAVDEVYLIRAESLLRLDRVDEALEDLNLLLRHRYKTGTFIDIKVRDKQELLQILLKERRKELLMRGLRWIDVKRLNKEKAGINFSRTAQGINYTLNANSNGFALPLPDELLLTSGMVQNP